MTPIVLITAGLVVGALAIKALWGRRKRDNATGTMDDIYFPGDVSGPDSCGDSGGGDGGGDCGGGGD